MFLSKLFSKKIEEPEPEPEPPTPVPERKKILSDFIKNPLVLKYVTRVLNLGVNGVVTEFYENSRNLDDDVPMKGFRKHITMNRGFVPCQDAYRVYLKFPGLPSDYYHANYIGTIPQPHRFICAQTPLRHTQHHFWAMVVQEEVASIVMFDDVRDCNCDGKRYWPTEEEGVKIFGPHRHEIKVRCTQKVGGDRTVLLNWGSDKFRLVTIHQYPAKIDYNDGNYDRKLFNKARDVLIKNKTPILVHCSTGVGLSGMFILMSYMYEQLLAGVDCSHGVHILSVLRQQRYGLILEDNQYLCAHAAVMQHFMLERHSRAEYQVFDFYKDWDDQYSKIVAQREIKKAKPIEYIIHR